MSGNTDSPASKKQKVDPSFKTWVKEFVTMDDNLELVKEQSKTWKDRRKDLEGNIKEYMRDNEIQGCALADGGGTLVLKESKKKPSITKKRLEEKLSKRFGPEVWAEILKDLEGDESEIEVKFSLKRVRDEKPGNSVQIPLGE